MNKQNFTTAFDSKKTFTIQGYYQWATTLFNALFLPIRTKRKFHCFTTRLVQWQTALFTANANQTLVQVTLSYQEKPYTYLLALNTLSEEDKTLWHKIITHQMEELGQFYQNINPAITLKHKTLTTSPILPQSRVGCGTIIYKYDKQVDVQVVVPLETLDFLLPFYKQAEPLYTATPEALFLALKPNEKPCIMDILSLVNDDDYNLIVQNFLTTTLKPSQLWQLIQFTVKHYNNGVVKHLTTTISDFDGNRWVKALPPKAIEGQKNVTLLKQAEWEELNIEVLNRLQQASNEKKLELSSSCKDILHRQVALPQQQALKSHFIGLWQNNFAPYWSELTPRQKERCVASVDNRLWAEMLALMPENYAIVSKYISNGRKILLQEEINYIETRGVSYPNALNALKEVCSYTKF